LGTVRDLVNAAGAVINHLAYDSFGQLLSQTNPPAGDRYTYTGREYDAALGQYYYRARFYDPRQGRFTSEDPLRFAAGDANLYRYVGNSSLNWIDPWGHEAVENAAILRVGPTGAMLLQEFAACMVLSLPTAWATSFGIDAIRAAFGAPPSHKEMLANVNVDFVLTAISCFLFPPALLSQTGSGAVAVAISATLRRAAVAGAAGQVAVLAGKNLFAYATIGSGGLGAGAGDGGGAGSASNGGGGSGGGASGGGQGSDAPKGIKNVPSDDFVPGPNVTTKYKRPSGAGPTAAQREAVQGKPCVDCGKVTAKQVADHKDPLVVQHYREGTVGTAAQSAVDAVQPHCPACSAKQGGFLSAFSRRMKELLEL
jgi:RHS repeat-associated protein